MSAIPYLTNNNISTSLTTPYAIPTTANYIYLHHLKEVLFLPTYGEANNDSISVTFSPTTPLMRTAPIQSYSSSGPRSLLLTLNLHRDLVNELNTNNTSMINMKNYNDENTGRVVEYNDYVDLLAKHIQAAALPVYLLSSKMVNPPLVSLKLGDEIFIKGVIGGSVGVSYGLPILANGKYAIVTIAFSITEVMPYDATTVLQYGSFRGISTDLQRLNSYVVGSQTTNTTNNDLNTAMIGSGLFS